MMEGLQATPFDLEQGTDLVRALSEIPRALSTLKDLFGRGDKKLTAQAVEDAEAQIDHIRDRLAFFVHFSKRLSEAKEWHDHLSNVDAAFVSINKEVASTLKGTGRRDWGEMRMDNLRVSWDVLRGHFLTRLLSFADGAQTLDVASWRTEFDSFQDRFADVFKAHEQGDGDAPQDLGELVGAFHLFLREQLAAANGRIVKEASVVLEALGTLGGGLARG